MNHHYETLEYPEILAHLADYTDFSGGRALALELLPTPHIREARERLALTREAVNLNCTMPDFDLGGIYDIRPLVGQAQHGVTLQPPDFLQVRGTVMSAGRVRRTLTRLEATYPGLADIAWRVHEFPALVDHIARVLNDRGEVRDDASPALARIRRDLHIALDRIQEKLRRIIGSSEVQPYLQEVLVTRREGRFVIPVQADFKGHIQGIVHDRSASGATLFMEPTAVVELNNALRELHLAEEDEIRALLRALTAEVADVADEVMASLDALSELDLALAKARYALAINATEPELLPIAETPPPAKDGNANPGIIVQLKGARHPLIHPEKVVPVDVLLEEDTHVVILTGPNTGGKTVSLKTVGLMTLMAQAGMFIPVDSGSALSCFEQIYADIGDEQSIEQSLSTFSSHLTNIIGFLEAVDHHALVLLDELGAGTDPAEGAALARALLEAFRWRRCTAFVATHYPELKLYAHNTPGVRNASMEFNVETLAPTYHLTIGVPGRSNAFAIARRLGLPESVVKHAQEMISGEDLRAEDMLDDLHKLRIQQALARDEAIKGQKDVAALQAELRTRLINIEQERHDILKKTETLAEDEIEGLRAEIRELRGRLLSTPLREAQKVLAEVETDSKTLEVIIPAPEPLLSDLPAVIEEAPDGEIGVGDTVKLTTLNIEATVLELDGDEAIVQAGSMRTRVPLESLDLLRRRALQVTSGGVSSSSGLRAVSPGVQIDLRGQTTEEALERLERYLDTASLATLPWVRIVHGKGTGKLRQEIRRFLDRHPLVTSYESAARNEGGDGATVAHLVAAS
ncbi:MAG: endonuclease MutS2 [Anaerolineae bacterium]|nr:endonuclease MutS2 [Anaerolineae bacterium]